MSTPPGCGFVSFGADGSPTYLSLKSISARVYIIDTFARVVLIQLYTNDNVDRSSAAQYVFPIPARGAVCSFKMRTSDEQVVNGVVKERSKARNEYDVAILNNQWAGLLYEATPDVFVISMGAIAPEQDVEVTIMYVVELSDGDLPGFDQAEFRLQTFIADRYGHPPKELSSPVSSSAGTMFDVTAEIHMTSEIISIASRSHSIIVDKKNWKDAGTFMYTAKVKLDPSVPAHLDRDFVLSLQSSKLGQPRCVAERRPSEMTVAMSLTFVPRFELDQLPVQEYIFLVDRSGSMSLEIRIDQAKDALLILLKSLPNEGTLFNIFSFGSSCSSLWYSSQQYTSSTLAIALQHVNSMSADMGGTEIENSLRRVLMSRNHSTPTSVFLLTDGEAWAHDNIFRLVDAEVMKARNAANGTQLRIFTLGVGDAASTALCDGVARRGNGLCLMTAHSADISQKCARLLAASTVPPLGSIGDIVIDWGYIPSRSLPMDGRSKRSDNNSRILFNEVYDPLARATRMWPVLPDAPKVQQAPTDVPDLCPANRFTVYAILSDTSEIPKTVTLHGTLPNGSQLSLPPVNVYEASDVAEGLPPLIHTLAANRLITELEDGNTASQGAFDDSDEELREAVIEAAVVRLSETYQLASQLASFIAIDEGTKDFKDDDSDTSPSSPESDSERDHGQLDGFDGRSDSDIPAADVYSDDDEDDSDILDGKDDDEFYSALSSAASAHSLSMASQYPQTASQVSKLSATQPAPNGTPPDRPVQFQSRSIKAFNHGGDGKFTQHIDDVYVQGQGPVDRPTEPLHVWSKNAPAFGPGQLSKPVDADHSAHVMMPDSLRESALEMRREEVTSIAVAPSSSQSASSRSVEKMLLEPVERVQSQPSQQLSLWLPHGDTGVFSTATSAALAEDAPVPINEIRVYEGVEMVNDLHENLRKEVRSELRMESLPKLRTSLPSVSILASFLAQTNDVLPSEEDEPRAADSSVPSNTNIFPSISTAIDVYKGPSTTLALAERTSLELESPEDDLLGFAEPPSAGSHAYESIDSVLSKLSMQGQTAFDAYYQYSDGGASEDSAPSLVGETVLSVSAADVEHCYDYSEVEGYPRIDLSEVYELLPSASPPTEASELGYDSDYDGPYDVSVDVSRSPSLEEYPKVIWIPASASNETKRRPAAIVTPSATTSAPIVAAARLQHYDGSFDLDDKLCSLMGKKLSTTKLKHIMPSSIRGHQDAQKIWATILAAAYMKTCLADNRDVWIGLWQKATNYIKARLGADISLTYLVDEASKLL